METYKFIVRVKHDNGIARITTWASDEAGVKQIIMAAEKCPERAILSIRRVEPKPKRYVRKTYDEYDIEGEYEQGWEVLCSELNRRAANERIKDYRENAPGVNYRIRKHRVKIADTAA